MKQILRFFQPLLKLNIKHPFVVLGVSLLLAIIGGYYSIQLKVDTDIANLLPADNPNVLALEKLKNTVGGETEMQVAINSPSFEANKRFAEDLIPKTLELFYPRYNDKFFKRAEFQKETEIIKDNALYLANDEELDEVTDWLQKEIETAREEANPFFIDFEEDEDEASSPEENKAENFKESYDVLVPSEYPINEDSTIMVVKFYPTGAKSDTKYLEDMFAK